MKFYFENHFKMENLLLKNVMGGHTLNYFIRNSNTNRIDDDDDQEMLIIIMVVDHMDFVQFQ